MSKQDYEAVQSVNESLAREVTALKTSLQEEKEKVRKVQNKLKKHNPINAQKREKRKQEKIEQQQKEIASAQKYKECMQAVQEAQAKELEVVNAQLANKQAAAQRYKQRWLYWRSKAQTTANSDDTGSDSDDEHNLALRRLNEEIAELEEMNAQLNDEIKELTTMSKQVETIEDRW